MSVHILDPLTDPRWHDLVMGHQRGGVFHTREWLATLKESCDFRPIAFSTSPPNSALANGLVFCETKSWITGRRLMSLPFSDHCDPLVSSPGEYAELIGYVREFVGRSHCTHAEFRPISVEGFETVSTPEVHPAAQFMLHVVSLKPSREALFRNLHRNCIQRKVRRAEREGLEYEVGRSEFLLDRFYGLLVRTRRRHGLPPQPRQWFRNLMTLMGDAATIRVASKGERPVAAILTLTCKQTLTYKYGGSDERFSRLGGTPFLFWRAIQEATECGMQRLDLGRSELADAGLMTFKERLGGRPVPLTYFRCPRPSRRPTYESVLRRAAGRIFRHLPGPLLTCAGRLLHRHFG